MMTNILRRAGMGAAIVGVSAAAVLFSASPALAAPTFRVIQVQCSEESDEVGDDSPYFMAVAFSKTNPNALFYGKWGPGYLDDEVNTGETFNPNTNVIPADITGMWVFTILLEEDSGNDISMQELQWIGNNMFNQYQIAFWWSQSAMLTQMKNTLKSTTALYLSNDEILGSAHLTASSTTTWQHYTGDGSNYWVSYAMK